MNHSTQPRSDELPDATLTEAQRDYLKFLARWLAQDRNHHELMFLAGAVEDAARRMRDGAS